MQEVNPPFLELNFYFADLPEREAFARLVIALVELSAEFAGKGAVHKGQGIRDRPFVSITDQALALIAMENAADITRCLADPDMRLVQVYMHGATGTVRGIAEIVTYLSISSAAAHTDHHPLGIWTTGEVFSGTLHQQYAKRAKKAGKQAYQRFRMLVESLRPAYAAITIEWPLECPEDLRRDSRSLAFRNFFVSRGYLGGSKLSRVRDIFTDAYVEPVGDGVYISCMEEFNPEGRHLEAEDAAQRSVEVAKLLAATKPK